LKLFQEWGEEGMMEGVDVCKYYNVPSTIIIIIKIKTKNVESFGIAWYGS
jgi:hypothetical protein